MKFARRNLLKGAGLVAGLLPFGSFAAGAALQARETASADDPHQDEPFKFVDWPQLRNEFDQDYSWLNFAGFLLASRPHLVERDIDYHRRQLNRNPATYLRKGYEAEYEARALAGKYFGVSPRQVSLTANTTMGLAMLYNNISIKPGQEILSTEHEHYSCITSLKYRSEREGLKVNTIRLYEKPEDASAEEMLARLRRNINARTRVLALTWVHSGSSVKLPVAQVGKMVRELNVGRAKDEQILYCVDGVHGFGVEDTNFDEMGCDFFVAGTHKWMFGPSGTGIMVSRQLEPDTISPTIPPFNFTADPAFGAVMTPGGFHSFEHRWALRKAFEFHLAIGKDKVQSRIRYLNTYLKNQLNDMAGVELVTPMSEELSAGFTFFRVAKVSAEDVEKFMNEHRVVVSAADRDAGPVVRMAPGLTNTTGEIDTAIKVLREIAG